MAKRKTKIQTKQEVLQVLEYANNHTDAPLLVINCENMNPDDTAATREMILLLSGLERLEVPVVFLIKNNEDPLIEAMKNFQHDGFFMAVKATEDFKNKIYKAANFLLTATSTRDDIDELRRACRYSVVPITHAILGSMRDYDPVGEAGNSFTFKNINAWEIFGAITRALETFRFPYDWNNLVKESQRLSAML